MKNQLQFKSYYPWLIWGLGAFFFFIEYFLRVSPSVIHRDLMAEFHIKAVALGVLSASFYYAYIIMQLPVGIVTDRYGPRKMLIFTTALCAFSCVLFAVSDSLLFASIARFLMGFSAAFAFVGTLKLASNWFDAKKFALLTGLTQTCGMLGAAVGDAPMSLLFNAISWRYAMLLFALILIILCLLMYFLLSNQPQNVEIIAKEHKTFYQKTNIFSQVKQAFGYPQLWLNCLFIGLLYGPTAMFAENWGVSYTASFRYIDTTEAAFLIGLIFIGLAIGCTFAGALSDRLKSRVKVMRYSAFMCFILMSLIIYVPGIPYELLIVCYFLYGVCNSGIVPSYTVSAELVPHPLSATALGLTNMASVLIGAILVQIVAEVLQSVWSGLVHHGFAVYTPSEFQTALIFVPIIFIGCFLLSFFIKETFVKA